MEATVDDVVKEVVFEKNKSLFDSLYDGFRESILKGFLRKGDRINLSHYAERFNVSRTPIRQALLKIEDQGLIRRDQRYGFIVVYSNLNIARETLEMIMIKNHLYSVSRHLYFKGMTVVKREVLKKTLDSMKASGVSGNYSRMKEDLSRFFEVLTEVRENISIIDVLKTLEKYTTSVEEQILSDSRYRVILLEKLESLVNESSDIDVGIAIDDILSSFTEFGQNILNKEANERLISAKYLTRSRKRNNVKQDFHCIKRKRF